MKPPEQPKKRLKKSDSIPDKEIAQAIQKLDEIANKSTEDKPYDLFGRYVASEMRQLPNRAAILLQQEIQKLYHSFSFSNVCDAPYSVRLPTHGFTHTFLFFRFAFCRLINSFLITFDRTKTPDRTNSSDIFKTVLLVASGQSTSYCQYTWLVHNLNRSKAGEWRGKSPAESTFSRAFLKAAFKRVRFRGASLRAACKKAGL
ncbi:hypothetical protein TNCV_3041601 [Trichonephila clavipes]|nr:hypothetical protein TNCV_3041601 [Trichonephila clavipes]